MDPGGALMSDTPMVDVIRQALPATGEHGGRTWEDWAEGVLEAICERRDQVFGPGNDKVWGPGEWVRCADCPDATGFPSYHHRAVHT